MPLSDHSPALFIPPFLSPLQTPDKNERISKRLWASRVLNWKKAVHAWDPPSARTAAGDDGEEDEEEEAEETGSAAAAAATAVPAVARQSRRVAPTPVEAP